LIRELGDRHTILLSTHIMSEVEAVCGRVIIIAQGRIAIDDRLDRLQLESTIEIEARGPVDAIRRGLETVQGVKKVSAKAFDGDYSLFDVQTRDGADLREALAQRLFQNGWPIRQLTLGRATLEERFIQAVTRETMGSGAEREGV
jgi:ABC-2 type transport system ATP-binding protein